MANSILQSKTTKTYFLPAHPQKLYTSGKGKWTDVEPEDYSPVAYPVSKQLGTLLRHGHLHRSVSHSSTESEIISLDAGLRLDGIPALDLWDLIVAVLHGNTYQSNQERRDSHKSPTRKEVHGKIDDLNNIDFISSNVNSSRKEALLYVFEDNETVIKMIIKGRSPDNETCFQNPQSCS